MNQQDKCDEVLITGRVCEIHVEVTRSIWPGQYCYVLTTADRTGGIAWEEVSTTVWPDPDQAFAAGIGRAEAALFPSAPSPEENGGRILPELLPLKGNETIVAGAHQRLVPVAQYYRPMLGRLTKLEQSRLACSRMNYDLEDVAAIGAAGFLSMLLLAVPGIATHSLTLFWLSVAAAIIVPLTMVGMDFYNEVYMLRSEMRSDFVRYTESGCADQCPACSAKWQPAPEVGRGANEIVHSDTCEYMNWLS